MEDLVAGRIDQRSRAEGKPFWQLLLIQHFGLELIFNSLVFWSFTLCFGPFQPHSWQSLLLAFATLLLLKNLLAITSLAVLSRPIRNALSRTAGELSNQDLERALSALPRLTTRYTISMTALWLLTFVTLYMLLPFALEAHCDLPSLSQGMILGISGALFFGPLAIYPWQLSFITNRYCEELARKARQRSLFWTRSTWTLPAKVFCTVVAVFLVCLSWSFALLLRLSQDRDIEHGRRLAQERLQSHRNAKTEPAILLKSPGEAEHHHDARIGAFYAHPKGRAVIEEAFKSQDGLTRELRQRQSTICLEPQRDGSVQVRFADWDIPFSQDDRGKVVIFAVTLFIYCALVALYVILSLSRSLRRLQRSCEDHLRRGQFNNADFVPSLDGDETASLTESVNEVIVHLRESAQHVALLAKGDLSLEFSKSGDLDEALRSVTNSLRRVVGDLRAESNRLASRSESLQTMTTQQDKVLDAQARAVAEVDRVALAISRDSGAASMTLAELEKRSLEARSAAAAVLERTLGLDSSLESVRQASQVIRTIARRARVLALNAAVEAVRGNQGLGEGMAVLAREARELSATIFRETETFSSLSHSIQNVAEACKLTAEASHKASAESAEASLELRRIVEEIRERGEELGASSQSSKDALRGVQESIAEAHAVAKELAAQALQLRSQIEIFRLPTVSSSGS